MQKRTYSLPTNATCTDSLDVLSHVVYLGTVLVGHDCPLSGTSVCPEDHAILERKKEMS